MAFRSIKQCDSDLKISLYNNIVLAGGSTLMNGFAARFEAEIRDMAREDSKTDINVSAALHRKNAAWVGGSMISSFSTFKDMAVVLTDYSNLPEPEKKNVILKKTIY